MTQGRSLAVAASVLLGLVVGGSDIANTSLGWHIASGREIVARGEILRSDPFTFTAEGSPWIDHEWGFQLIVALVEETFSEPGLVALRALLVAALSATLALFALAGGLSPPLAVIVAGLCLYGAHIRFYLRPELFTMLIAAWAVRLILDHFSDQAEPSYRWLLGLAVLTVIGINLHGAILVLGPLAAAVTGARILPLLRRPAEAIGMALQAALVVLTIAVAACLNPWGWAVYSVPLRLMELVSLPQIPNPEWISPSPSDLPSLYVGLIVAAVVLLLKERDLRRWALLVITAYLALRFVRNVGLFFVLLPLAAGPALSRLRLITWFERKRWLAAATALLCSFAVVAAVAAEPRSTYNLSMSDSWFPRRACVFLEQTGLTSGRLYNDVRFGGYLLYRSFPPTQVFIDDRNEIHEPLLTEIWQHYQRSDVAGFTGLLDEWQLETALIRYNPPFEVQTPEGEHLAWRGYSALWFPPSEWGLVYWDDVAMVLVRRTSEAMERLSNLEYRFVRPDDLPWILSQVHEHPELLQPVSMELARKLSDEPDCRLALNMAQALGR